MRTQIRPHAGGRREDRARRSAVAVAVCLLLAVAATACGGGDGGSAGSAGTSAPGVTGTEVKVAIVVPKTGPAAPTFDGFAQGAEARFAEANAAGGVNGRQVKVVTLDDAGDGAQQVTVGRNAVQSEKAFGVISASRVDTMMAYLKQNGVPVVGYPGQPAYANDRNVFGAFGAWPQQMMTSAYADKLKALGATKVAVFAHNSPGSTNSAKAFIYTAQQVGLPVTMTQFDIPLGSFDATALAVRMKQLGIDGIYLPLLNQSNLSILQAAHQQGVKLVASYVTYDPAAVKQADKTLEGVVSAPSGNVPLELDNDAVKRYKASMAKYAPGVDPAGGLFTTTGWIAADLFLKGLELAGPSPTRETFIDKLRQMDGYDGRGLLTEKVSFKPGVTPDGNPVKCYWFLTVSGAKYVPDGQPTCGNLLKLQ